MRRYSVVLITFCILIFSARPVPASSITEPVRAGNKLYHQQKYDEAIYYLKEASDLMPNDATLDIWIADIYLRYKEYREQGIDYLKKAKAKATTDEHKEQIRALVREAKK